MNIYEAASILSEMLSRPGYVDENVQCVGVSGNTIIVYTVKNPTRDELGIYAIEGYDIEWKRMGRIRPIARSYNGSTGRC